MDVVTIVSVAGIAVNVLTLLTVLFRWSRWTGIVDTKLDDLTEHFHKLPCARVECRTVSHQET
jgi:hypothetical protein